MDKINISRGDVLWGYVSQVCNVGANLFILPVLFYYMSGEELGVWYIFMNINTFVTLFGLVFQSSFSRNISYAFSGATSLQKEDIDLKSEVLNEPNVELIKGLLVTLKRFYGIISIVLTLLLVALGLVYFRSIVSDRPFLSLITNSWILYSFSISVSFYCLYYGSILQGRGYIRELNQLIIIVKLIYIGLVFFLVSSGYNLWSIALASLVSTLIHYVLGYFFAYKNGLNQLMKEVEARADNLMEIIWNNTCRLSFATLFNYLSTKGNLFYISLFLPLSLMAQYGLVLQVVNVLTTASLMYFFSYTPLVAQSWILKNKRMVRDIYTKSLTLCLSIFTIGSLSIALFGDQVLDIIGSNTTFLPTLPLCLLFIVYLLDANQGLALSLIISKNKVPHLKASIISALFIYILIPILILKLNMGIYGVIVAVGVTQLLYQNWKWPTLVSSMLGLSFFGQLKLGTHNLMKLIIKSDE